MGKLTPKKRIGIMGGMGPLATVDLYQKITQLTCVECDQDHLPIIIDSYPQIEDRTAYILGKGENPLPKMIASANRLKNAGADALLIACNTAHYFVKDIKKTVDIEIIHIVDSTIQNIISANKKGQGYQRIAVLATDGTIQSGLYQKALQDNKLCVVNINSKLQKMLMACIYEGAKQGRIQEYQEQFQFILDSLSADAYIAACTEIPLFTRQLKGTQTIIDATTILAQAAIDFSLGKKIKLS